MPMNGHVTFGNLTVTMEKRGGRNGESGLAVGSKKLLQSLSRDETCASGPVCQHGGRGARRVYSLEDRKEDPSSWETGCQGTRLMTAPGRRSHRRK